LTDSLLPTDKAKLFDKDPSTKVTLPAGQAWIFGFKTVFEINKIKVLDENLLFIAGIEITVYYPDSTSEVLGNPATIEDEINGFKVKNTNVTDVDIAEIAIETMDNVNIITDEITVVAEVDSSEAEPLHVEQHQTLIAEDFELSRCTLGGVAITQAQLDRLFNKHSYIGAPVVIPGGQTLSLYTKMPIRLRTGKVLNTINMYVGVSTYLTYRRPDAVTFTSNTQPFLIDSEVNQVDVNNLDPQQSVSIGQIVLEKYFDNNSKIVNTEAEPGNVEQHQTLVAEDFERTQCVLNGAVLLEEDLKRLFSKHTYTSNPITINAGMYLLLNLKIPMRVKIIKLLAQTNLFIAGNYEIEVQLPDGTFHYSTNAPLDEYLEIKYIKIADKSQEPSNIQIFQIVAEKYFDTHSKLDAPECAPVNVQPLEELVAEDIWTATAGADVELNPNDLANMFDKHLDTYYALVAGDTLNLNLKKTFRISAIKLLTIYSQNPYLTLVNALSSQPFEITVTYKDGSTKIWDDFPVNPNDEITRISIHNIGNDPINIHEIIAEMYLDRVVRSTENQPVNINRLGEMVLEDVLNVEIILPPPSLIHFSMYESRPA